LENDDGDDDNDNDNDVFIHLIKLSNEFTYQMLQLIKDKMIKNISKKHFTNLKRVKREKGKTILLIDT